MAASGRRLVALLTGPGGGGLVAALVFALAWSAVHAPRPPQPTADIYTHLSVARHLLRGEGFRTDVAYPLSFAFPFARELPQPLVHRRPGLAVLLTGPVALAGGDPAGAVARTRGMMLLVLAGTAGLGAAVLLRRGEWTAVPPWLLLLGAHPLLAYGVDWGFEEVPAALLLLGLWWRRHAPGPLGGALAGALALVRLELLLLPAAWWVASGARGRPLMLAGGAALLVLLPWAVRDLALTGRPLFLLQGHAELVKDTRGRPGYAVYRGLEPMAPARVLREAGEDVLRKGWRGLRFFRREAGGLAPWPVVWGAVAALAAAAGWRLRRRAVPPDLGAAALLGASLLALAGLYAFFDHSLRHLLVLVPTLLWETSRLLGALGRRVRPAPAGALLPAALAANLLWLCPSPLPGWETAARAAGRLASSTAARAAALAADPAPVAFTADAASPWYADRPAVWTPDDPAVAARIRAWMVSP